MAPVVSPGISPLRTAKSREEGMLTTFGVLSLITSGGISATEYISTGNSITLKGNTGDGVLTVSADGSQLLFNGVAVQLTT